MSSVLLVMTAVWIRWISVLVRQTLPHSQPSKWDFMTTFNDAQQHPHPSREQQIHGQQIGNPGNSEERSEAGNYGDGDTMTIFMEPPSTLDTQSRPLPPRRTEARLLQARYYPNVTCSPEGMVSNLPIDDFPTDDPYLPWIHDYFIVAKQPDEVRFVAQNRRRCETGKGKDSLMKFWEPQIALFQPIPVDVVSGSQRVRLGNPSPVNATKSNNKETRFLCRFHNRAGAEQITLSTYTINYEYVHWRKHKPGSDMFVRRGTDVHMFEYSQLIFSCPMPPTNQHQLSQWERIDIIPIRTPARRGKLLLTSDHIGPTERISYFDPAKEFGSDHWLPAVQDSGRIANLPLCRPTNPRSHIPPKQQERQQKHQLVICTWVAATYHRRGDRTKIEDTAVRLREWIVFHKLAGADHIYLYDNTDAHATHFPLRDIANLFPEFVTHHPWPAKVCNNNRPNHNVPGERSSQYAAEASCRERYGPSTEWMSFIDIDEYLVPMMNGTWPQLLQVLCSRHPGIHVWKLRSSRGRPRLSFMDILADGPQRQEQCQVTNPRQQKVAIDPCLVPRRNETFLRVYNCDFVKPPRPQRFARAMKQIYRPSFVLSHFVHYATITTDIARVYAEWNNKENFSRKIQSFEWGDQFMDEISSGILVHTKSVQPQETMTRSAGCQSGTGHPPCAVGIPCPDSTPFNDAMHGRNPFHDGNGNFCNCWLNQHVEKVWIPKLEEELRTIDSVISL